MGAIISIIFWFEPIKLSQVWLYLNKTYTNSFFTRIVETDPSTITHYSVAQMLHPAVKVGCLTHRSEDFMRSWLDEVWLSPGLIVHWGWPGWRYPLHYAVVYCIGNERKC